jgi:hypothetical protein
MTSMFVKSVGNWKPISTSRCKQIWTYGSDREQNEELDLVLHTIFDPHIPLSQAHIQAEEIQRALRQKYPDFGSVIIHTEPPE